MWERAAIRALPKDKKTKDKTKDKKTKPQRARTYLWRGHQRDVANLILAKERDGDKFSGKHEHTGHKGHL